MLDVSTMYKTGQYLFKFRKIARGSIDFTSIVVGTYVTHSFSQYINTAIPTSVLKIMIHGQMLKEILPTHPIVPEIVTSYCMDQVNLVL